MTEAVKEALWIWGLVGDLGSFREHVEVHCESQSSIHLAKKQVHHGRTKYIDVRYHFKREIIERDKILLRKIGTKDNPVDMLTKVVPLAKFKHFSTLVNIIRC